MSCRTSQNTHDGVPNEQNGQQRKLRENEVRMKRIGPAENFKGKEVNRGQENPRGKEKRSLTSVTGNSRSNNMAPEMPRPCP